MFYCQNSFLFLLYWHLAHAFKQAQYNHQNRCFYKISTCHWGKSSFNKQFKSSSSQIPSFWTSLAAQTSSGGGEPGIAPDYLHYKPKATSNSIINLTTCFKSVVSLNFMALRLMATLKQAGFWWGSKNHRNSLFSERRQEIDLDLKQPQRYSAWLSTLKGTSSIWLSTFIKCLCVLMEFWWHNIKTQIRQSMTSKCL